MEFKRVLVGIVLVLLMAAPPLFFTKTTQAENDSNDQSGVIIGKLNQVLDNQKAIAADIASMKQELSVVKIRVTQSQ
ncbi:MAG: hypothetical protein PHX20_07350 [Candidatus Omnitrophica bacterium]|nr:hypothetical protein [Candidatus Omnitrophota bacterium]MDD5437342.1 hypothetical protein [Candidatus Omnitrophota bacterium]